MRVRPSPFRRIRGERQTFVGHRLGWSNSSLVFLTSFAAGRPWCLALPMNLSLHASLADAEAAEDAIENIVGVDRSDDLTELIQPTT